MRGNMLRAEEPAVRRSLNLFGDEAQDRAREKLGSPGPLQEWHRVATFNVDDTGLGKLLGFGVRVTAAHAVFDLSIDACNVGLLWDDAQILEAQPVQLQSGGIGEVAGEHIFRVNTVRGRVLEVWTSGFDSFGSAEVVDRSAIPELEAAQAERQKNASSPPDPSSFGLGAIGPVLAVALVVVALVYFGPMLLRTRPA